MATTTAPPAFARRGLNSFQLLCCGIEIPEVIFQASAIHLQAAKASGVKIKTETVSAESTMFSSLLTPSLFKLRITSTT